MYAFFVSPTLAVILLVLAFAIVGVFGLWFLAGETRRFHEESAELERQHREIMDRANRALEAARRRDRSVD